MSRRTVGAVALAMLLALSGALARADTAPVDRSRLGTEWWDKARDAFWWGDFDEMARLYAADKTANPVAEYGPDTAYQRQGQVRRGFSKVIEGYRGDGAAYHAEVAALTLQWTRQHPDSALAHVLHAEALIKQAWQVRGGGYAKDVLPQAWEDFRAYIKKAGDHLTANAKVAFTDTRAHHHLITIGRASSWPLERQWAIAQEGLKLDPNDRSLYFDVLTSALPKWGGSVELVDSYINEVTALTKDRWGMEMYASLYFTAADEYFGHQLFEDSLAKWPKIKAGLEQRIKRTGPGPYHNNLAYMACLAKDRETFLEQLEAMGDEKPRLDGWGKNPQATYDSCKRWALKS